MYFFYLQMHPQSIYYSLRTFVLGLREAAQRALQDYSKHRAGLEAAIAAAVEAAGGDEQSECGCCLLCSAVQSCSVQRRAVGCCVCSAVDAGSSAPVTPCHTLLQRQP
jgi:hypothetical protein